MATYQPLRDAFREWNRMLIDGQQFNKQHELNQADQRMRERQLESQLGLQAFNIKMAGARHELAKRGEQRAANSLALQQLIHTDRQAQQAFTNNRNIRKDQLAEEVHGIQLDTMRAQRDMAGAQAEQMLYNTQETQLDFAQVFGPDIFKDENKRAVLNQVANIRGYEIGDDGLAYDADGSPYTIKRYAQKDEVPWILGRMLQEEDPHLEKAKSINNIQDNINELNSVLKDSGTDNYNLAERARIKREINKLKGEAMLESEFFSPENQTEFYRRRADTLRSTARFIAGQGDANYANVLLNEADDYEGRVQAMNVKGNMVQLYDRNTGEGLGKASYNTTAGTWKYDGEDYRSLSDMPGNPTAIDVASRRTSLRGTGTEKGTMTQNQAMTLIERAHSTMNSKGVPILSGVLEPRLQSTRELVTRYMNEGADSMNAASTALEQIKSIEQEYWDDIDYISTIKKDDMLSKRATVEIAMEQYNELKEAGLLRNYGPITPKMKWKEVKAKFNYIRKAHFKYTQRKMGVKNPYTPNQTMRKIQQGMQ
jgi:hypothetical protein